MKRYIKGTVRSVSVICREVNKNTGEICVYQCKRDVEAQDLGYLALRTRYNPEMRYYALDTRRIDDTEDWEEIESALLCKDIGEVEKELKGVLVRLGT